ncbi:TonB-dependent receptor [Brevundimonas goettingensis]|uniref:TonB-dependent siderophore receptor n=1 Tax=Brevundimonas goettingensis TaxID=2774190 RepID=A0A975GW70_9CAUL|nr:TonB-dependent siderophore receptor [Brevundimonas goettingensis]QTC91434.1 TonB-dependent siderophore receptor [Brevundimonas goettingensis]
MTDSRAATLRALLFASSAAGMLCAAPALAADVAPEGPIAAAPDAQQSTAVGDVDVNGQRRRAEPESSKYVAPLVDTPRNVTVIPQQVIEQIGATSLQDLLRTSPGITMGAGEGGQPLADRPFIRGQSSGNNIFVDGIRDSGGQQREVFNLEQVEVIKGPDSAYSGRGSGGGSINLSSKTPKLVDFTNVSLGGGTDSYWRGTIDQNWRINDSTGFRINILSASGDVANRNAVDYDKLGVAASFAVGIDTATTATLSFNYLDSNQMPDYGIPLYTKKGSATTAPRPNASGVLDVPYDTFYGLTARDYLTNTVKSATLRLEHQLTPNLTIRNITRYAETLNDYVVTNPGDGGTAVLVNGVWWMKRGLKSRWNPVDTTANVTELFGTFNTGSIKHSFSLGAEFTHEVNDNASWTVTSLTGTACPAPLTGVDCTPLYNPNPSDPWTGTKVLGAITSNTTDTKAVYAFDSIELGDKWLLNLGLRWDDYSVDGVASTGLPVAEASWDFTNYQVGLVYKPTQNTSIYGSVSTSSTPPPVNGGDGNSSATPAQSILPPEDTLSYEIGAKASLFRQQLQLSIAAFSLTRENASVVVDGLAQPVGEVEVQGIEIGFSGNITPQWQVFGGYTYQSSELVQAADSSVNEGDPLANTPENNFSLFTTYRLLPKLVLGGGVYYVSDSNGGNQGGAGGGANGIYAPAYTRVDAFASYDLTERATLQLNVQNATDEEYILRTNGVHHADPAPGRSATLALNVRF